MAVYQRGSVFWWKSRLRFRSVPVRHIMVRISLRTASPSQARARAAQLELARNAIMEQLPLLRREMKPDDLPIIYKGAFERELDTIILKQATDPGRAELHRATNLHYARYLTLLATEPRLLDRSLDSHAELQERGLSATDADALSILSQKHRDQQPISHRTVSHDLMAMGVKPTTKNMQACAPTVAAAYRDACIAACESLGLPISPDEVWPLPAHLEKLVKKPPHASDAPAVAPACETVRVDVMTASAASMEPEASAPLKQSTPVAPAPSLSIAQPRDPILSDYALAPADTALMRPESADAEDAGHAGGDHAHDQSDSNIKPVIVGREGSASLTPVQNRDVEISPLTGLPISKHLISEALANLTGFHGEAQRAPQSHVVQEPTLPPGPLLSDYAQATVAEKVDSGAWKNDRQRDILAAVAIFVAANGDVPVNRIEQQHLSNMARLFRRLPKFYGHKRKVANGTIVAETIEEALIRGDGLREIWKKDPVEAERQKVPYVGLSLVTQNKHLTWMSALVTQLEGSQSHLAPKGLNFAAVRKTLTEPTSQGERAMVLSGQKANTGRLPWSVAELQKLFGAPIWQGCAGLWHRFTSGTLIIHDGSYWVPLLLISNYGRISEIAGLATDDVHLDCDVPYFQIRENALRGVKTASSVRDVPIPSRVLELGFADYVRAMRAAGHKALFPEFHHPTMNFQKNFSKIVFDPLRNFAFPDGTSRKRGRKDVDCHSIRTFGMNEVSKHFEESKDPRFNERHGNALGGHEQSGTAAQHYLEDLSPRALLPQVDFLTSYVPDIPKHPLNLRPPEHQKFGRLMGRPPKIR